MSQLSCLRLQTHNRKNLNRTRLEKLENIRIVTEMALDEGATVRAYLSTVFGCPYEGDVSVQTSVDLVKQLLDLGISEISLGDSHRNGASKCRTGRQRTGVQMFHCLQSHFTCTTLGNWFGKCSD